MSFSFEAFFFSLPGAALQGLIWGLMAIGVYISYKILDIADLTVDGSIVTGMAVFVVMSNKGVPIAVSMISAFIAGALAGTVTGILHTALGVPAILAGIVTQLMLYTVNMLILSDSPFASLTGNAIISSAEEVKSIFVIIPIIALVIIVLWLFFYTQVGLTLKSTGDNPDMSRAQGVNVKFNQVLGLAISNGIVALAGSLYAQYKAGAYISDGQGAIVIGLAAIFIGLSVSLKIKPNFVVSLIGVVGGGIVYFTIYNFVLMFGISTTYLKIVSALIVALFIAVPYLKGKYFTKPKIPAEVLNAGACEEKSDGSANMTADEAPEKIDGAAVSVTNDGGDENA